MPGLPAERPYVAWQRATTSNPGDFADEDEPCKPGSSRDETAPTPGDHLFYALGQVDRLYRHGALNVQPIAFDVTSPASWGSAAIHNRGISDTLAANGQGMPRGADVMTSTAMVAAVRRSVRLAVAITVAVVVTGS